ncbi:MAG: class I SAM-dependent methyltransferase [Thermoflexales bacterium]|nr:class I SAM-dependent methyltransferase [Thermoflexales bacterium]
MVKVGHDLSDAEIAARYDAFGGELSMRPYFYPAVADFVGDVGDKDVLDAGCGSGQLLQEVKKRNPTARLYGMEVSAASVAAARQRLGSSADIRLASLSDSDLPFGQQFDLILLTEVLEHLKSPVNALRVLRRSLKPGGELIITFPNAAAWLPVSLVAEPLAHRVRPFRGFLPHEHPLRTQQPIDTVFSISEVLGMLKEASLGVKQVHCRESFPYVLEVFYKFAPRFDPAPAWSWVDRLVNALRLTTLGYRVFLRCAVAS